MEERGAVVRVQPVQLPDGERTWTVLGADQLPVPVVESYLELLRQTGRSLNTVKSHARALQLTPSANRHDRAIGGMTVRPAPRHSCDVEQRSDKRRARSWR